MPQYACFGITLHSPVELPLLIDRSEKPPDVVVEQASPVKLHKDQPFLSFSEDFGFSRIIMRPAGVGQFTLTKGTTITFHPDDSGRFSSLLELYLTGSILSLILYQRGLLVLHGSVVRMHKRAVAFLGHSGAGKSSAAAACCLQRSELLADDIVAVSVFGDKPLVQPGFPRLKVHLQTAEALHIPVRALAPVHPDIDDEFDLSPQDRFCTEVEPLVAIYLLTEGEKMGIEPVAPALALVELLQHAMPSRYGENGGEHQFQQLSTLVRRVPVFRLQVPRNLELLHTLPQHVANHLADGQQGSPLSS